MRSLRDQYRRIAPYLVPHRWRIALAALLVIGTSVAEILKPWPLKIVVDNVVGGQPLVLFGWPVPLTTASLLLASAISVVAIYVVIGLLQVTSNYVSIDAGQRMVNDLRSDLYQHMQRLSLRFHAQRSAGDLLYRLASDTFSIQTLAMNGFFPAVYSTFMLVGMIGVMVRLNGGLTAIALAVCPAIALVMRWSSGRISSVATAARERESEMYARAQRAVSSIKVIQAFSTEEDEHRAFIDSSRASLDASLRLYTVQTVASMLVNLVGAAGTAGVIWFGAEQVMEGRVTVGDLLVFTAYLASLWAPIHTLSTTWGLVQSAKVGVERVFEILETGEDVPDGSRELARENVRGAIRFEDVHFEYQPGQPVLRGVTLDVEPGETIAIVGQTGAGKTTLMSLLVRFYDPKAGRILLDGIDTRDLRIRSLRRQIAMVLQPALVFPTTLRDNIAYGRKGATPDEVRRAASLAQLDGLIAKLPAGLDTVVGERGLTISEGECQRITIARAILRDSPIQILDEPTSALDAETESLLMRSLEELMRGRTSFVIAHRLSTIRRASRIVVLRDGVIAECGSFDELMARQGIFAHLQGIQQGTAR